MARRVVMPTARRGQAAPPRPALAVQTALPDALLIPLEQLVPDPGQPRRHEHDD